MYYKIILSEVINHPSKRHEAEIRKLSLKATGCEKEWMASGRAKQNWPSKLVDGNKGKWKAGNDIMAWGRVSRNTCVFG